MYVLENKNESERLESQSQMDQYCPLKELSHLQFPSQGKLLDAGCGTGLLTKTLHNIFPQLEIEGCDLSEDRINYAKNSYSQFKFFQKDLVNSPLEKQYDIIVNRYVAHHLGVEKYEKVLKNFYQALTSGGSLGIIDVENNIVGLGTTDEWLSQKLKLINESFYGDLYIGRKIPSLLKKHGFQNIDYKIEVMQFKGSSLVKEIEQIESRIDFARDFLVSILGETDYLKFKDLYLSSLDTDAFFYNKFIIQAYK